MLSLTEESRADWARAAKAAIAVDPEPALQQIVPVPAAPVAAVPAAPVATQQKRHKQQRGAETATKPQPKRCRKFVVPKQVSKDFVKVLGLRHHPPCPDDTQRLSFIQRELDGLTRRLPQPSDSDKAEAIKQDEEKFYMGPRHPALYFDYASLVDAVLAKRSLMQAEHWLQSLQTVLVLISF